MTTITREWLQQTIAEFENTRDDIPFGLSDDDAKILIVLKRALAVIDAEPVRYLNKFSGTCVTLEQQSNAADDVAVYIPLYAAPPVQETGVYKDMLNIISLLENNEWAEHCTSTVLGSLLESEITRLVGKEQPAPVVPDEMATSDDMNLYQKSFAQGYNACRAAMLQGAEPVSNHDELALYYLQGQKDGLEWAAQLAEANHPLTGDWLYDDPLELAKAIRKGPDMPGFAGSSPVTQDGWISCSERMPDNDESKPIAIFTGKCLGQGMFVATYDDDGFFDYWEGMEIIGVSHWMPLPAAPEPDQS
ncbi:TPA: DUF551 domain-containing protein [Salmonella enterica subsp. enterica serovar Saintpaul]|uniref:Eaa protein n=1 Tax=Salmonella typhimurium TaxID=90371 RepID=A0A0F7JC87_SALTM|nr:DUF551 domain-containing protein [Salmonella enterica]MDI4837961.1 DUF551 domain-containing protein [Salmonella enterica subsp. enterica serovar Muenchen]MEA6799890.1 DUF551 domain-containing protein [Salmonella enterica subsp. enterica serovar Lubbock]MEB8485281.1 DUF551 domain-containing protein [Salmonella enterica subsp. enterica serovar Virginia]AKH08314.1 Eaa protein [Salmonella enterica subsp. enterica serovar Typhimurium]ALE63145.1 hypothetical protein SE15cs_02743 [Salmonella enter